MALPAPTCPEIRERLELLLNDIEFQRAVRHNPTALVDDLTHDQAMLVVQLVQFIDFPNAQGGGGKTFGPWRSIGYP